MLAKSYDPVVAEALKGAIGSASITCWSIESPEFEDSCPEDVDPSDRMGLILSGKAWRKMLGGGGGGIFSHRMRY